MTTATEVWERVNNSTGDSHALAISLMNTLEIIAALEVRLAALEAARPTATPKVLYEGEASVPKDDLLLLTPGAMSVQKRVYIVVTAVEGDDES